MTDALGLCWNGYLLDHARALGLPTQHYQKQLHQQQSICMPVIYGYVESRVEGPFSLTLISRRSRHRCGTRYNKRGLDTSGAPANAVETEQIVEDVVTGNYAAICLYRGSLPVYWSQKITGRYKPSVAVQSERDGVDVETAAVEHFSRLVDAYEGPIHCLDLLSPSNIRPVQGEVRRVIAHVQNEAGPLKDQVTFQNFDFHKNSTHFDFTGLARVADTASSGLDACKFFVFHADGASSPPLQRQQGVLRVNCVDCIDRTNIAQCFIGDSIVGKMVSSTQQSNQHADGEQQHLPRIKATLRALWTNNGRSLSRHYAGTGALFCDVTLNGQRTFGGVLRDGVRAIRRYYQNHFHDGRRQDAISLLVGAFEASDSAHGLIMYTDVRVRFVLIGCLVLSALMILVNRSASLQCAERNGCDVANVSFLTPRLVMMMWVGVLLGLIWLTYLNRRRFLDVPRLTREVLK
eukprot:PhM_4_TR1235/c1_g1_i1/m.41704/K21797/SAC1, SACM1L; phosphatidylinositol 4-phosphatase